MRRSPRPPGARCHRLPRPPRRLHRGIPGAIQELIELTLRAVLLPPVPLLENARELVVAARRHIEIVVGELAPLLLDAALHLLPLAGKNVAVHVFLLSDFTSYSCEWRSKGHAARATRLKSLMRRHFTAVATRPREGGAGKIDPVGTALAAREDRWTTHGGVTNESQHDRRHSADRPRDRRPRLRGHHLHHAGEGGGHRAAEGQRRKEEDDPAVAVAGRGGARRRDCSGARGLAARLSPAAAACLRGGRGPRRGWARARKARRGSS